jgi:quinol monooxygenase YgiN
MIVVAGHLRVAAADRELVLARSRDAVSAARGTRGCLDFVVAPDLLDATRVNVFERWTDRASLHAFRQSGPDDELGSLILEFAVDEFEVVPTKSGTI